MTFSIVARDHATGAVGIAIASKALAVGAIAPFARANLVKIGSALAPGLVSALRNAVNRPEPAPMGSLTAWAPPAAATGQAPSVPGDDAG